MYEAEANNRVESLSQIPPDVVEKFREFQSVVTSRTALPWSEHCTECVWPTCYTTCDLYHPREDGRCRRFVDGMVRIDCPGAVNSYLLKIRFKRWGKLWSPGNIHMFPLRAAADLELRDLRFASALVQLPLPKPLRKFATTKRYSWKRKRTTGRKPSLTRPDSFVVECYNPQESPVSLSLTLRSFDSNSPVPFQKLIMVPCGFHREQIEVSEISKTFDLGAPFHVELIPNEIADGATIFFGLIDFVQKRQVEVAKGTKLKCVVWDLDKTLWDGILIEDGPENVTVKSEVVEVIRDLDRRGILHSIASKNTFDDAMQILKKYKIDEYFLSPQISWGPKSESMRRIAQSLNIGIDSLMLVDDSEFELAEVQSACPNVRTLNAEHYRDLLDMPECQVPVTAESANRRFMYRQEGIRKSAAEEFGGDYLAFLRNCRMEMTLRPLTQSNIERVHELTQRTNQMNFSGNRYNREVLREISVDSNLDTYVIECRDRFGSYGIVGFSIVDKRGPRMTDLMFSCRIQAKRVEHAFLSKIIKEYVAQSGSEFWANYRKTSRNAQSGRVFQDLKMREEGVHEGVTWLVFDKDQEIVDEGIVQITMETPCLAPSRQ
ncbi:MAG: HAD-IIIC family phosphatase [Acidobacteriota bacterium]